MIVSNIWGTTADPRILRDLVQVSPKWYLVEDSTQLATAYEAQNLGTGILTMEAGSTYILDEGSVVII